MQIEARIKRLYLKLKKKKQFAHGSNERKNKTNFQNESFPLGIIRITILHIVGWALFGIHSDKFH